MSTSDVATAWAETEAEDLTDDVLVRIDDQSSRGAADHGHHDLENTPDGQVDQVVLSGDDFVNIDGVSSSTKPSNRAQAAPGLIIDIADSVMTRLVDRGVSPRGAGAGFDASSVELHSLIIAAVDEADRVRVRQGQSPLPADVREHVESAVMAEIIGTGPLDPYLSDPDVEEIDVNSAACTWVTWCDGRKIDVGRLWPDDAALTQFQKRLARRMSATGEGRLDTASPTLTLQTRAGDRVVMVLGGESEHGLSPHPRLSIRRYVIRRTGLSGLVERGLMVPAAADFLSAAVRAGCTVLISGPPGAGKTTLLTELLGEVDPDERIITVEKHLLELGLEVGGRHRDSVALHTRGANAEGLGEVATPKPRPSCHWRARRGRGTRHARCGINVLAWVARHDSCPHGRGSDSSPCVLRGQGADVTARVCGVEPDRSHRRSRCACRCDHTTGLDAGPAVGACTSGHFRHRDRPGG